MAGVPVTNFLPPQKEFSPSNLPPICEIVPSSNALAALDADIRRATDGAAAVILFTSYTTRIRTRGKEVFHRQFKPVLDGSIISCIERINGVGRDGDGLRTYMERATADLEQLFRGQHRIHSWDDGTMTCIYLLGPEGTVDTHYKDKIGGQWAVRMLNDELYGRGAPSDQSVPVSMPRSLRESSVSGWAVFAFDPNLIGEKKAAAPHSSLLTPTTSTTMSMRGSGVGAPDIELKIQSQSCTKCGASIPASAKFCGSCGTPQSDNCKSCGAALSGGADQKFCMSCGKPV